ncbi:calcium-binding protein [Bradyrhizobium centrosematis]|uniref:calcium-binding protein n=1 Tax=Bradyrhizobium centrosematis TaxID=1300039 RepID=UPI0021695B2C|nr:calcium-binding protein [Bradyrhizobium centrosematis]MCS3761248.1 Ca2+-binding RTX toxin-like protein [Bradyrhizobium centrosematis]MCS3770864.1 Ca2+-binding RTX toxin-like protein [Bradyrhizobium centrosematis]
MSIQLTGAALYAALSEHIYRRNETLDQSIKLSDITGGDSRPFQFVLPSSLNYLTNENGYIYSGSGGTTGFAAMVNFVNGKYVVTIRGTDSALTAYQSILQGILNGSAPTPTFPSLVQGKLDNGDAYTSRMLGWGTGAVTQWDATKGLVEYVIQTFAHGDASQVVVTGQSMGGGLAGLASAYFGVQGYVFAPAPYGAQLDVEAMRDAMPSFVAGAGAYYFNQAFAQLTTDQQVAILQDGSASDLGPYLQDMNSDNWPIIKSSIKSDLSQFMQPYRDVYNYNIDQYLHVQRVDGEMLTADDTFLGGIFGGLATQLKDPDPDGLYEIGDASDEGKHSPALHALLALTAQSSNEQLETLFRSDEVLRYAIVGEPNGILSPTMTVVSAPQDHGRIGPSYDAATTLAAAPDSYLMEDVLWKAYASGESNNLYDYFYKLFYDVASKGAAGKGIAASRRQVDSVHDGVVKLALEVLRDAIQDTNSLAQVKEALGGKWIFAGGDADGVPFSDKIVLKLDQIKAALPGQKEQLLGGPAQVFGVREINTAVAQAVEADLSAAGLGPGQASSAMTTIIGGSTNEIRTGASGLSLDWRVLVVQAGEENGTLVYDAKQANDGRDASASHLIIGGNANDEIKGSSVSDYLIGGDGDNKFESGGGSDVIVGGKDKDTYTAHSGGGADSVVFLGGAGNEDTAIYGSDFSGQTLTVTYSKLQSVDPHAGITVQVGGQGKEDTLIGVETVKVSESNTTVQIKDDLSSLTTKVKFDADKILGSGKATVDFSSLSQGISLLSLGGSIRYGNAAFDEFSEFKLTSSDDTVRETEAGLVIDLGGGNDTVKTTGAGTTIHTGSGSDKIEASHNGQLLIEFGEDEGVNDHITYYGNILTGGVQWGTEGKYAYGSHGERYGRNAEGNLVIIDGQGNETFIPGFNFTTDASSNLTAGLYVIQVTYRIERSNGWTAAFETAASALTAMKKIAQALTGQLRSWTDPLVLDLNGDGVNLSSMAGNNASFDVDKDGFAERVGWVRGGDGMLVRDLNGNGKIDDIGEMFGNDHTPGFTQLASLDGNHDGKISALDDGLADFNGDGTVDASDTFATLKVWIDANEDGKTDAGELKSLASLDIVSISTGSTATNTADSGNVIAATGTYERSDGTTGTVGEVHFDTDNTHTTWLGDSSVSTEAAARPDLKGFGTLTDLHVAMTLDADLIDTVDAALPSLNTLSLASLREAARPILYAWAGAVAVPAGTPGTETTQDFWFVGDVTRTGGIAYDFVVQKGTYAFDTGNGVENRPYYGYASGQPVYWPNSTTVNGHPTIAEVLASTPQQGSWTKLTAQDIAFLERYTGVDLGFTISEHPSGDAIQVVANGLTASWNTLNRLAVRLAAQGPLAPFFAGIAYDVASDTFHPTTDHQLVPMLEAIFHAAPATATGAQDFLAQWHDIINVVLPDFQRDNEGHQLTDAFLFQNLVGAYEDVPLAISLQQAASIFDIAPSKIKTGSGTLIGDDGNTDLFYLDASDQVLKGQGGSDAYVVGYNFGHDVIQDVWQGLGQNQEDSLWFSHLNVSDLTFTRDGVDLLITQNGTSNQIRVVDEFAGRRPSLVTAFQDFDKQIEFFKFADGTTWDQFDLAKVVGMQSYATDDHLLGSPDVDFLNGGAGTDYMSGGDAGDHYFFGRGYGHDTVEDGEVWIWQASNDYVHFGAGITEDDVTFQRVGVTDDLQVKINGTDDVLTVAGQFGVAYGLFDTHQDRIEIFTFEDGSYIGWEDIIKALDAAAGTSGNDTIYGFSYDDLLDGGAGNDYLSGGNGTDTYVFGRGYGSDTIEDGVNYILSGTDDTVQFKAGISRSDLNFHHDGNTSDLRITFNGSDDILTIRDEFSIIYGLIATAEDRIEYFTFADGTVLGWHEILVQIDDAAGTSGNDMIYGFGYDDTLQGRAGDDYLYGSSGNDTYVYSRGDGHDTVYDIADAQGPEFDTLVLHGINPADVSFARNGIDVALVFAESAPGAGDGGSVLLQGELDNWFNQGVEQVIFDDGTIWTQSDLRVKVLAQASTAGNDTIVAFNTNDVIEGGRGDDTISGGAGDDTYIYTRGDGNDSITEVFLGNYSSIDTLRLHDIDPASIRLVRSGNDLTLQVAESAPGAGDGGSILLKDELAGGLLAGVEQIVFDDGTAWNQDQMRVRVLADAATDGNDTIYGFATNDTLRGGKGDDALSGGAGDETYIYSRGDGHDTIYEVWLGNYSSFDTLRLQSIAPSAVQLTRTGDDMTLVIAESAPGAGDGGSILLKDEQTGRSVSGVEQIVFDDGTLWTQADLRAMWLAQESASTHTSIYGFGNDDTIVAGTVDRYLNGGGGQDTYIYGSAGGNVVVADPSHLQSTLQFTDISSTDVSLSRPVANDGANLIITVNSTGNTVTVLGEFSTGAGALRSISFADGTVWNPDQVKGVLAGTGAGGYIFSRGDGQVSLDQSVNTVLLGAGITADDIILQASGNNLMVKLRGTSDSITVAGDLTKNAWGVSSTLAKLQFSDGTSLALGQPSAGHGLPLTFTWFGTANNYWLSGSNYGSNVFEIAQGNGTIIFGNTSNGGDGKNTIKYDEGDGYADVTPNGGTGVIAFGSNVPAQDVYLQANNSNGDLTIRFRNDTADSITIRADLSANGGVVTSAISQLQLADGSVVVLGGQGNLPTFTWLGNGNNYYLTGGTLGTNVYEITVGNGTINFANNTAVGGTNIVKYSKGAGYADVSLNGGKGVISFNSAVSAQDVYFQAGSNGDVNVKIRGDATDLITLRGDLVNNGGVVTSAVSQLQFSDGSTINLGGQGNPPTFTYFGAGNNYYLTGGALGTNVYEITAGNGSINFANNTGVGGTNIVKYSKGAGYADVSLNGGKGVIAFDGSVSAQDVYWQSNGSGDLTLKIRGDSTDFIIVHGDLTANAGVVSSAITELRFSDGSTVDLTHGPYNFTWLGNTSNFTVTGATFGTNIYEVTAANGTINFADASLVGGTNIVRLDKGTQSLYVQANNFAGSLELGPNILAQDVYWQSNRSGDLIMKIRGDAVDSVNVLGDLHVTNGVVTSAIKNVKFSDGTVLDMSHGPTNFTWLGNTTNFTVTGTTFGTNIYEVTAANGTINFADASAVGGTNIVRFDKGTQSLYVQANNFAGSLELGPNILAQDVYWQSNQSGDLILKIRGDDADSVNVLGDLHVTNGVVTSAIKTVKFSDGTALDMSQGPSVFTWIGSANNYNLVGSNMRSNVFEITQGNGAIKFGNASGGGDGNNTIRYDLGDGLADVQLNGGKGVISFGSNVSVQDVTVGSNASGDLIVKFRNDTTDAITVHNDLVFGNPSFYGISAIQFADGTTWDYTFIAANAWFRGTAGNESIYGSSFGDTIFGDAGNDYLQGNDGSDTYIYRLGDGNDEIADRSGSVTDVDTLKLADLNAGDVTVSRSGNALRVTVNSTGAVITVDDQFYSQTANWGVERLLFANGESWDLPTITANAWFRGTSGNESLNGSSLADTLLGGLGNDYLQGNDGSDAYIYALGDGNDEIADRSGSVTDIDTLKLIDLNASDVTLGRTGNALRVTINATGAVITVDDQFYSQTANWGIEKLLFANGDSWDLPTIWANAWFRGTSGNDSLSASSSADTLLGDQGNDYLQGNGGSDTYLYRSGDGNDEIADRSDSVTDIDTLKLTDLDASDVTLSRSGNALRVTVNSTGVVITVDDQFYSQTANWGIEKLLFANGDSWDLPTITANAWIRGTSGNDTIGGSNGNDVFWGGLGDDRFNSGAGSDTYVYARGDGNDYIDDESGSTVDVDVLRLTDLNASDLTFSRVGANLVATVNANGQTITFDEQFYSKTSNWGIERIEYADGTNWDLATINSHAWIRGTSGNDTIGGSDWNDVFWGGLGDDRFNSGAGSDTYVYARGDGNDYIDDESGSTADVDVVRLTDLNASDLTFSRVGAHLVATVITTGQTITFDEQFYSQTANWGIESLIFADGRIWNRSNMADATSTFTWAGSATNATLTGNDYGANIFQFGSGAESAYGGARNNVYQITTSTGQSQINLSSATGSNNEIDFLSGITDQNLWFEQAGNDLKIDLLGSSTNTTISNWFSGSAGALQEITAGGLKIDSQISQLVQAMATYSANHAGFDPANPTIQALPNDTMLQSAVTASWHA